MALTADLGCGVLGDHGVGGELGVQDAAVRVGVHGQCVQQLTVLQHPRVLRAARLRHQGHHVLCGAQPGLGWGWWVPPWPPTHPDLDRPGSGTHPLIPAFWNPEMSRPTGTSLFPRLLRYNLHPADRVS